MNLTDLTGTLAALLTTLTLCPQAWHTFQTKDVSGISLGMYSAFALGVALWLAAYRLMLQSLAGGDCNAVTLALGILAMKADLPACPATDRRRSRQGRCCRRVMWIWSANKYCDAVAPTPACRMCR